MFELDLSTLNWKLIGWRPYAWLLQQSLEIAAPLQADTAPIPAKVPGSVHDALLKARVIDDWHVGLNSRACEWIENRHWHFSAILPAGAVPSNLPLVLNADGLDYSGWLLIDGRKAGRFEGTLVPYQFALETRLSDGENHRIGIVFDEPPREMGQIGYTSRSRHFKPRYPYSWDWVPRVVPVGVWDRIVLRDAASMAIRPVFTRTSLAEDNRTGSVAAAFDVGEAAESVTVRLMDGDTELASASCDCGAEGRVELTLGGFEAEPWWPNGHGNQKTYTLAMEARVGPACWRESRSVGFKRVRWLPCEGAPENAEPWICEVNGKPIFLQGCNWVPTRICYHDSTEAEYRELIALYRDMGCTVLRVWGGAILEKQVFYEACDAAGILVWQEFPLSSSGVDNWPPEEPEVIEVLKRIASSYIRRRAHHVSLLLWCGGNELLGGGPEGKGESNVPCDCSHPCIAAMRAVVERDDPGRRFLPTSASGPLEWRLPDSLGKGKHHDVHGPWGFGQGADTMDEWQEYWESDDALFRSEVGMPGAQDLDLFERYGGGLDVWPPTTPYWVSLTPWWTQWGRLEEQLGDTAPREALPEYIRLTQSEQAEAYAIAAAACKKRFPRCGGFIVWHGHDLFPCPANNAVIQFSRRPKPAYHALRRVFTGSDD